MSRLLNLKLNFKTKVRITDNKKQRKLKKFNYSLKKLFLQKLFCDYIQVNT